MKILVCGGRNYQDKEYLFNTLNNIHEKNNITCVVQGGATGADYLAFCWALVNDIEFKEYRANWIKHGMSAGPIRNKLMLEDNTDIKLVVAFEGGPGTKNMINTAFFAGIDVLDLRNERFDV